MEDVKEVEFFLREGDKKSGRETVQVTNTRFVVGANVYAMNGVTSVKKGKIPPKRKILIFLAIVFAIAFFNSHEPWNYVAAFLFIGTATSVFTAKPTYFVTICTSATETKALASKDREYIDMVIDALTKAIIKRG
jgi:hypothetical protein